MTEFEPENQSLKLLTPPPNDKLAGWLREFFGKPTAIAKRQLLRHRDLSYVERLTFADALPESLIYKVVLPPWEVEQDLHERVLIPSITNSAQLYLSAHFGPLTALFMEDVGEICLFDDPTKELAGQIGKDLAKMHRSYSYRTDELGQLNILRTLYPSQYQDFAHKLAGELVNWELISAHQAKHLVNMAASIGQKLSTEPVSLVHGDLYAENIILRADRFYIIDWSWFTILGAPIMDLATLTARHAKNGRFYAFAEEVIDSYCFESGRDSVAVRSLLPAASAFNRLLFLHWLTERRSRGIMGTTVGPVGELIKEVVRELLA